VTRHRALVVGAVGVSIAVVGLLFAFYFPTRSWLHQRQQASAAEVQLQHLQAANKDLEAKARALNDPQTIKNTARGLYGLVEPGQEPYVVLPAPAGPTTLPQVWPFVVPSSGAGSGGDQAAK
jgi:type II secretory pathway pseudopilin PulG